MCYAPRGGIFLCSEVDKFHVLDFSGSEFANLRLFVQNAKVLAEIKNIRYNSKCFFCFLVHLCVTLHAKFRMNEGGF